MMQNLEERQAEMRSRHPKARKRTEVDDFLLDLSGDRIKYVVLCENCGVDNCGRAYDVRDWAVVPRRDTGFRMAEAKLKGE